MRLDVLARRAQKLDLEQFFPLRTDLPWRDVPRCKESPP
jgi:hypothetical protein